MELARGHRARHAVIGAVLTWDRMLWAVAALCLAWQLVILVHWIGTPILDEQGFRQSQTALTAYWLMQGGPFFAYETPVVGAPWSIPFELPVYQGIVALVAKLGVPLDPAGRLVSEAFFLASFWPLRMLWRDLRLVPAGLPIACALLFASPIYAFWSRTFMIESCALFFAVLWLALLVRFLETRRVWIAGAAMLAGLLAAGAKATTLPPFALLGGLFMLPLGWRWLRAGLPAREWPAMMLSAAVLVLPFVGGFAWVAYADALKAANPIGRFFTSAALSQWNWGTPGQRWSAQLWDVVSRRAMHDAFGAAGLLAVLVLAAAVLRKRAFAATAALVAAFLTPFLLFTNLHTMHNYYQYANAAFLLVAVAVALGVLASRWPIPAGAVLLVLLAAQTIELHGPHWRTMGANTASYPLYRIAQAAREHVPEGGSLLVLGEDWSSAIPYYAQRKALALPTLLPVPMLQAILQDPQAYLAGTTFAGVVSCIGPVAIATYGGASLQLVDTFLAGRALLAQDGDCRLYAATR